MCGKVDDYLNRVVIEGVELNVCSGCSRFGKVIGPLRKIISKDAIKKQPRTQEKEEKIELLVEDYADLIKKKRESIGLSQKDFASKINEKESTVHHIETGTFEPNMALTKKLERMLGIKLIEEHEEKHGPIKKRREEGFTLGDFINVKNRR